MYKYVSICKGNRKVSYKEHLNSEWNEFMNECWFFFIQSYDGRHENGGENRGSC